MSVSILEALQNAEHNLEGNKGLAIKMLGMDQLHTAIMLLEKGHGADTEADPLLAEVGGDEDVPEATEPRQ